MRTNPNQVTSGKLCNKCNKVKRLDDFSLAVGKHSHLKKSMCKTCESDAKKAKKNGVTLDQYVQYKNDPCVLCGDAPYRVVGVNGTPVGSLCKKCHTAWGMQPETIMRLQVMATYAFKFPFYLKYLYEVK